MKELEKKLNYTFRQQALLEERSQQLSHDHGVHQIIQLLKQHPKQGGQSEAKNQPHRTAHRQIPCHKRSPPPKRDIDTPVRTDLL